MVKYSIMVPVYNKKNFLKKYFKNILNQSFDDYEIVVVDDFSTDGSHEYLSRIDEPKLHLYRNSVNVGLGENRNLLLKYASGEYVLFVDPDDYINIDLLKKIDEYNDELDIIRFQNEIVPASEKQYEIEKSRDKYRYCCAPTDIISGEEALMRWCLGERKINTFPWTYAIKHDLYKDVSYPKTSILEDFAITPYLIAKADRVMAIPFVGYYYLKYDDSLSNNSNDYEQRKRKLDLFKQIIELTKSNILSTDISDESKAIFISDINNRYKVREKKLLDSQNNRRKE